LLCQGHYFLNHVSFVFVCSDNGGIDFKTQDSDEDISIRDGYIDFSQ